MRIWHGLINAFSYFTILPVPASDEAPDAYTIGWLPLVGAFVGFASGWGAYGTFLFTHSHVWCAITAFTLTIILTGAIHVDGFLDCCDALLASTTVERRLEILKDPRHGTYAIVGMALLSIVWLASLYQIEPTTLPLTLAIVGVVARIGVLSQVAIYPHARTGKGVREAGTALAAWLLVLSLAERRWTVVWLNLIALGVAFVWGFIMSRRLNGGLTGDTYGALVVITEVGLLKVAALYPMLLQ